MNGIINNSDFNLVFIRKSVSQTHDLTISTTSLVFCEKSGSPIKPLIAYPDLKDGQFI